MAADDPTATSSATERYRLWRLLPLAAVAMTTALVLAFDWHRELSVENLVRYRVALGDFVTAQGWRAVAVFVALFIVVVALSIPGALFLTIASGVLFGTVTGAIASVIGATAGAALFVLITKTAFGGRLVRRAGPAAVRLAEGFHEDAFAYILFLRLVPFPFFLINLVAALANVPLVPFIAGTAIGIVPIAFALAFLGVGFDSAIMAQETAYRSCLAAGGSGCTLDFSLNAAITPELIGALLALGCFALILVAVKRLRARRGAG